MKERNTKQKVKINKIIIAVILCILLVVLLLVLVKCFSEQKFQANNDSNMGMVTLGDDYIFYYKYNSGLVKIKDGKEYQIANEQAYSVQYDNGFVYYTTPNSTGGIDIKKVSQNGDKNQVLASVTSELTKMYVVNGDIYYTTSNPGTISKMNLNGENNKVIITRNVLDFKVIDKNIYFTDDMEYLYLVDTNGENYKTISEEKNARKFQIVDNFAYFYDEVNKKLVKIDLEKKTKTDVKSDFNSDIYNVTSKGIYYLDSEKSKICFVDLKNKKSKEIISVSTANTKINVIGNVIYYLDLDNDSYVTKRISIKGKKVDEVKY